MHKFENVEYTKPVELLLLVVSTIFVFFGMLFILNRIISFGLIKGILAVVIATIYFVILKRKFIVKISDFELTASKLEWNNKSLDFKDIDSFTIHWMRGAGIKFKLKNGKVLRISSNDNFCNSEKFVKLCQKLDSNLVKYGKTQILRKNSFFETKRGYYFAIVMTILVVIIIILKLFTKDNFNIGNFALILVALGTIWSGIKWKRK